MKKINAKITTLLSFAILSAILFVAGIPMIIIGAGKMPVVMILGIIFTAFDFYACPLLFTSLGTVKSLKRTLSAILNEHLYTTDEIAKQTGKTAEVVKRDILTCIEMEYLTGLLFDGTTLSYNDNRKADKRLLTVKCVNCGAAISYYSDESPVCPYCGASQAKK